jgi:hypothetical protein
VRIYERIWGATMKHVFVLTLTMLFFSTAARADMLEAKTFFRIVQGAPHNAPPGHVKDFKHTLQFKMNNIVIDNGDSFFGNPPRTCSYRLWFSFNETHVNVVCKSRSTGKDEVASYSLSKDGQSMTSSETGTVFRLETP